MLIDSINSIGIKMSSDFCWTPFVLSVVIIFDSEECINFIAGLISEKEVGFGKNVTSNVVN